MWNVDSLGTLKPILIVTLANQTISKLLLHKSSYEYNRQVYSFDWLPFSKSFYKIISIISTIQTINAEILNDITSKIYFTTFTSRSMLKS